MSELGYDSAVESLQAASGETIDLGWVAQDEPQPFKVIPYDPARDRESTRGRIAFCLIGTLAGMVIFILLLLWFHPDRVQEVKDVTEILYAPIVGLVGAATGYYFGSHER